MTEASVFIIESLSFRDEREGKREGDILTNILRLSQKHAEYRYIRTEKELKAVIKHFAKSKMRYLHLSCHGNGDALSMTLDSIPLHEFGELTRPYLKDRRLFLSACDATNRNLALEVIPKSGCYSVIGPAGEISFGDAAVMWASFYHLMFRQNPWSMKRKDIERVLTTICDTFGVAMKYFGRSEKRPYFTESIIKPKS